MKTTLISPKIVPEFHRQIGSELEAFLQYLAIAAYFEKAALPRLAAHFARQAEEERGHAMRFLQLLVDNDADVAIPAIPAPEAQFKDAEQAAALSLERELRVTEEIHSLLRLARQENDFTSETFLHWFVKEQLEEVSSADQLLKMIQRAGDRRLLLVEDFLTRSDQTKLTKEKASEGS
ncbi:bacterioferritin B [Methylacidimicrobium cyclopophantes]|uniref:Ferritin n=1 Tax=Methylacidimicrobium cyclopophantes TaxID=1041766 RepID=A0A5E6MHX2_9BACT|nr:ferritin [Methylacidimicrobium cyclopophantes]VVM07499.1 bacterioferritin B [Methylacidimicrobium cyclopophantes]